MNLFTWPPPPPHSQPFQIVDAFVQPGGIYYECLPAYKRKWGFLSPFAIIFLLFCIWVRLFSEKWVAQRLDKREIFLDIVADTNAALRAQWDQLHWSGELSVSLINKPLWVKGRKSRKYEDYTLSQIVHAFDHTKLLKCLQALLFLQRNGKPR